MQPTEREFAMADVQGTLVAIRLPKGMSDLGAAGYHYHFITNDHSAGGHVLTCTISSGVAKYDAPSEMNVVFLPD